MRETGQVRLLGLGPWYSRTCAVRVQCRCRVGTLLPPSSSRTSASPAPATPRTPHPLPIPRNAGTTQPTRPASDSGNSFFGLHSNKTPKSQSMHKPIYIPLPLSFFPLPPLKKKKKINNSQNKSVLELPRLIILGHPSRSFSKRVHSKQ